MLYEVITVMIDESFLEFRKDEDARTLISRDMPGNVFILRSMTKIFAMPGLRMGYAVTSNGSLAASLNSTKEPRITSYNVCYTKLLRRDIENGVFDRLNPFSAGI